MGSVIGLNTDDWFFTLGIPGARESIGTQVMSMRGHISCMTRNISYNVA